MSEAKSEMHQACQRMADVLASARYYLTARDQAALRAITDAVSDAEAEGRDALAKAEGREPAAQK